MPLDPEFCSGDRPQPVHNNFLFRKEAVHAEIVVQDLGCKVKVVEQGRKPPESAMEPKNLGYRGVVGVGLSRPGAGLSKKWCFSVVFRVWD